MLNWQACQFLDQEAEVSEDDVSSDDDDDGSDLDSLDGSFIDDDTQLTQAPTTDHGTFQYIYQHFCLSTDMSVLFSLTSLVEQFYLSFCYKSSMLAARLASCQCLCISLLAVG